MIRICLKNLRKDNEDASLEKWLELPACDDEIQEVLNEIGIYDDNTEPIISDYECDIPGIEINKNSCIYELNDMANMLCDMDEEDIKVCSTIMKNENCKLDAANERKKNRQIITLNKNEDNINLNFAYSYIKQFYDGDITNLDKETLERYFDFESFGEEMKINFNIDDDETIAVSNA